MQQDNEGDNIQTAIKARGEFKKFVDIIEINLENFQLFINTFNSNFKTM